MEIEIWSDFACPWCAVGIYRLDAVRGQFEHGDDITVVHRSFELDPRAPAQRPETMEQVVAARYGMSPAQVRAGHERMTALGAEVGMTFDFDRVHLGSTFDAHRLAQAARGTAMEDAVVKGLFAAHFTDGRQLSDPGVLADVGAAAGMEAERIAEVLGGDGDAYADEVRADEHAARELGITGVPHFVINGKWAIPGAQDTETMLVILRRAWMRTEASSAGGGA